MQKKFDRTYLSASRDSQANTMEETQSPDPISSTRSSGIRYRRGKAPGHSKLSGILHRNGTERTEQVELTDIVSSDPDSNPPIPSDPIRLDLFADMS